MPIAKFDRVVPSAGTLESIGSIVYPDPVDGAWGAGSTDLKHEQFSVYGLPATAVKIAKQIVTGDAGKEYPFDSGVLQSAPASAGGTILKLHTGVLQSRDASTLPYGMLAEIMDGSEGIGAVRRCTSWDDQANAIVNVARAWTSGAVPQAGAKYRLLFDLRSAATVHLSGEFSVSGASCMLQAVFYDWPLEEDGVTPRRSRRRYDRLVTLSQTNPVTNITDAADKQDDAFPGIGPTIDVHGWFGMKLRFVSITSGSVSLWLART